MRKRRHKLTPHLDRLNQTKIENWSKLNDSVRPMIEELQINYKYLDTKTINNFFKFLRDADYRITNLDKDWKGKLYQATDDIITDSYNNENIETESLYNLYNVLLKLDMPKEYAEPILKKALNEEICTNVFTNEKDSKTSMRLSLMSNEIFNHYRKKLDFNQSELFFERLMQLNLKFSQSGLLGLDKENGIYFLKNVLNYATFFREKYENTQIDDHIQPFMRYILELIRNNFFHIPIEQAKQIFYINYVRLLPSERASYFKGLYDVVDKNTIFPNSYVYTVPSTNIKIEIHYDQISSEKQVAEEVISRTYWLVEKFKKLIGIVDINPNAKLNVGLFNDEESFANNGSVFGMPAGAGGFAVPSTDTNGKPNYNAYVYQDKTIMGENGFGRGFYALGHEFVHILFFRLVGSNKHSNLPKWLTEGGADWLGNGGCLISGIYEVKNKGLLTLNQIINLNDYWAYPYGSVLFRFMLEEHPTFLGKIIRSAQNGSKKDEIDRMIDAWSRKSGNQDNFNRWFKGIKDCAPDAFTNPAQPTRETRSNENTYYNLYTKATTTAVTFFTSLLSQTPIGTNTIPHQIRTNTTPCQIETNTTLSQEDENNDGLGISAWVIGTVVAVSSVAAAAFLIRYLRKKNAVPATHDLEANNEDALLLKNINKSEKLITYLAYRLFLSGCLKDKLSCNDSIKFSPIFDLAFKKITEKNYEWKNRENILDRLQEKYDKDQARNLTESQDNKELPNEENLDLKKIMANCVLWGICSRQEDDDYTKLVETENYKKLYDIIESKIKDNFGSEDDSNTFTWAWKAASSFRENLLHPKTPKSTNSFFNCFNFFNRSATSTNTTLSSVRTQATPV